MKSRALLIQVEQRIFLIRGQNVMLSHDLALLYGVEPGALNRAVKRNSARFPDDFMFQLSQKEWADLKCQFWHVKFDDAGITKCDSSELETPDWHLKLGR